MRNVGTAYYLYIKNLRQDLPRDLAMTALNEYKILVTSYPPIEGLAQVMAFVVRQTGTWVDFTTLKDKLVLELACHGVEQTARFEIPCSPAERKI